MDLVAAVVTDEQPFELVQPGEGALDDPAVAAKAGAVLGVAMGDLRSDPALPQLDAGTCRGRSRDRRDRLSRRILIESDVNQRALHQTRPPQRPPR